MEQVRTRVIEKISDTFNAVAKHQAAWIEPDIQKDLGLICEDLHISKAGTHQDKLSPVFFDPLGTHNVPSPHPTDDQGQKFVKEIFDNWDKPSPRPPTVTDQVYKLVDRIRDIFRSSRRDFISESGWPTQLRTYANWTECGNITPDLIAEEFDGLFWLSPRDQLNRPHTLLATFMKSEANETLSKYETMVMLAVMLTRLQSDDCPNHSVIPIMIISVFPGLKLRILETHYDYRGLVIRKSDFLSFANKDSAISSMDILMSFMCSKMTGNTTDMNIMIDPVAEVPPPPSDNSSQESRNGEVKSWSRGSLWRNVSHSIKTYILKIKNALNT
ncbi:uncharacterized protein BO88DRAFT_425404 [Aspergillus vadensis CBS 113365]|uniref:Uncharacterized protein n=1 Tax=Aspergillus vadensis (strain CBS 113365 / IMI 142717 / IBT 24658) TaxID=1448311 RepID=A0A319BT33_ASPVC|nr:hypothetical protein BO88DRAFT_425404 [Aspergillus vadensis CBS 113365]PYH69023.1 hypothetical protein BO88DRAFT_425404 [Aspergillus vadensis CBS 113365]